MARIALPSAWVFVGLVGCVITPEPEKAEDLTDAGSAAAADASRADPLDGSAAGGSGAGGSSGAGDASAGGSAGGSGGDPDDGGSAPSPDAGAFTDAALDAWVESDAHVFQDAAGPPRDSDLPTYDASSPPDSAVPTYDASSPPDDGGVWPDGNLPTDAETDSSTISDGQPLAIDSSADAWIGADGALRTDGASSFDDP